LKLANGLNADLSTKGMNGNVRSEISEGHREPRRSLDAVFGADWQWRIRDRN
jgi:hypothetical protein